MVGRDAAVGREAAPNAPNGRGAIESSGGSAKAPAPPQNTPIINASRGQSTEPPASRARDRRRQARPPIAALAPARRGFAPGDKRRHRFHRDDRHRSAAPRWCVAPTPRAALPSTSLHPRAPPRALARPTPRQRQPTAPFGTSIRRTSAPSSRVMRSRAERPAVSSRAESDVPSDCSSSTACERIGVVGSARFGSVRFAASDGRVAAIASRRSRRNARRRRRPPRASVAALIASRSSSFAPARRNARRAQGRRRGGSLDSTAPQAAAGRRTGPAVARRRSTRSRCRTGR